MLAGKPAFPDTTPHHLIQLITQADPPRLRKVNPAIPPDLETIVQKASVRDPDRRYASSSSRGPAGSRSSRRTAVSVSQATMTLV